MLDLNKDKWNKIDKLEEEKVVNNIVFVRPVNSTTLPLSCTCCKILISSIEDVEAMNKKLICHVCYELYYTNNKEKWDKGWRPDKYI
jgi:hypothetical protein